MQQIGIIGLGFMAVQHLKAYQEIPTAQIGALCNPSGRRLDGDFSDVAGNVGDQQPLKLEMTGVRAYRDFEAMLDDPEIDVIDICTPTKTHVPLATQALQSGKHILCEKPMARTALAAKQILEAANTAQGHFMPAMCLRFWPEWRWVKQKIDDETFGKVLDARFRRVAEPPPWGRTNYFDGAESGGGLFDLHIHDTDFVQFCFGIPKAVFSQGYSRHSGAIDHVVTQYQYPQGPVVSAEGSWTMTPGFGFNMAYTVNFEKATVDYDLSRGADALKVFPEGQEAEILTLGEPSGYIGELSYFLEGIRSGKKPTVVTAQDAYDAVRICEAEEASVAARQIIPLGEPA